jgi:hypothetical protein
MKYILLILSLSLLGCAKDCECGKVVQDYVDCTNNCRYYLGLETDCETDWVEVNEYTYMNTFVGDQYCK